MVFRLLIFSGTFHSQIQNKDTQMINVSLKKALVPAALLMFTGGVQATTFTPVSQQRSLECNVSAGDEMTGNFDSDSMADSAPDFDIYDNDISVYADIEISNSYADCIQLSEITPTLVTAAGVASCDAFASTDLSFADGTSNSDFNYTFTIDQDTNVQLHVYAAALDEGYCDVALIDEMGVPVFIFSLSGSDDSIDTTFSELLLAGEYTLSASAGGDVYSDFFTGGSTSYAEFDISMESLEVVCNGDLDGDGVTDQADLGILLSSYGIDAGGDLDGDGDTDQADLGILLGDYGCGL